MATKTKKKAKRAINWGAVAKTVVGFLIIAAIVITCGIGSKSAEGKWFKNGNIPTWFNSWGQNKPADEPQDNDNKDIELPEEASGLFGFYPETDNYDIALLIAPYSLPNGGVNKMITAVVNSSIRDPKLDWTIENIDASALDENVSELISIAPTSDGALTAHVTCYAPFSGTFVIKATLRDVGVYTTCKVTYVGIPTEIKMCLSRSYNDFDSYELDSLGSTQFVFLLDNCFHVVNEKYNDFTITVEEFGSVNVNSAIGVLGVPPWSWEVRNSSVMNFKEWSQAHEFDKFMNSAIASKLGLVYNESLLDYSTSDSLLTITVNHLFLEHFTGINGSTGVYYPEDCFHGLFSSVKETIGLKITVTENVSELTETFTIGFGEALFSKIILDSDNVEF